MFDRQHRTSENNIYFDFDLAGVIHDDQLGVIQILAANQACLYSKRFDPLGDSGQFIVDGFQRFIALCLPRPIEPRRYRRIDAAYLV
ncbi:hypothetical protein GCM10027278_01730 [Paralcaligenes ginsengisoli]